MALFGKKQAPQDPKQPARQSSGARALVEQQAVCRICNDYRQFSKCWLRMEPLRKCMACGADFPDPALLYRRNQPACPKCGEYLEQPGFEYGVCDGCGSKFELVPGTRPSLLPNPRQRQAMDSFGKSWSPD